MHTLVDLVASEGVSAKLFFKVVIMVFSLAVCLAFVD